MPPRKLPKLHCGGRDVKTGSCSSFCTDQRNNHCDNGGCFKFFCDSCIKNHPCKNGFKQADVQSINESDSSSNNDDDDDEGKDKSYKLPKRDQTGDDISSDEYEDDEDYEEEDEYDEIGDKEGTSAKEAWAIILAKRGLEGYSERHGLSTVRKVRKSKNTGRITCAAASLCAITVYGWTKITFSYHISILSMH